MGIELEVCYLIKKKDFFDLKKNIKKKYKKIYYSYCSMY